MTRENVEKNHSCRDTGPTLSQSSKIERMAHAVRAAKELLHVEEINDATAIAIVAVALYHDPIW